MNDEEKIEPQAEPVAEQTNKNEELTQLQKLEQEIEEYKDKYLRQLAEMENMRKRLTKERQEMVRFGIDNVIADMLMPLDNLDNALKSATASSPEVKNWALGFEMILGQFKEVLSQHGVSAFNSVGEKFDPFLHEAVEVEETDTHSEGTILQEFVKGYRCGERTIRPARVKVAKPPQKKDL
ncbi:MAG: nucleotide exchange factor GrpE [Simkania sp.]|nr:nucleotide exchange factor GrpE [Simkania sp.]